MVAPRHGAERYAVSLRSFPSSVAVLAADQGAAPPSFYPNAHAVVITPAAALPSARAGRTVAAGAFPVWLMPTDARGIPAGPPIIVTSAAPLYFARGTGERWLLLAANGAAGATDLAYDVTIGDDPGDWLEVSPTSAPSGLLLSGEVAIPNATLVATTLDVVAPPAARQIVVDLWCPSKFNTPAQANLNVSWQRLVAGQFVEQKLNGLALGGAPERMTAIARLGSATSGIIFPGSAGALLFYDSAPPSGTHRFVVSPAAGQTQSAMTISWAVFA